MAIRIPTVESPFKAPEVEPTINPVEMGLKIPEGATGGEQAETANRGMEKTNEALGQAQENWQKQADFAVENAYAAKLMGVKARIVEQAKTFQGINTLGVLSPAEQGWDESTKDVGKEITDPRQKDALDQMKAKYKKDLSEEVQQHVAENIPRVEKAARNAFMESSMASVASHWDNPAFLAKDKDALKDNIDKTAVKYGLNDDQKKADSQNVYENYYNNLIQSNIDHSQARSGKELLDGALKAGEISKNFYDKEKSYLQPHLDLADARENFEGNPSTGVPAMKYDSRYFDQNGLPNEEKIFDFFQSKYAGDTNNPLAGDPERGDRVYKDFMNFAREEEGKRIKEHDNSLRAYKNAMEAMHDKYIQTGDPQYDLSHAQNMAMNYKWDRDSQGDMQDAAADFYAPPKIESDPELIMRVRDSIRDGKIHETDLNDMKRQQLISAKDYVELHTDLNDQKTKKFDQAYENRITDAKNIIKDHFGTDDKAAARYTNSFYDWVKPNTTWADIQTHIRKDLEVTPTGTKHANPRFWQEVGSTRQVPLDEFGGTTTRMTVVPQISIPIPPLGTEARQRQQEIIGNLNTEIGPDASALIIRDSKYATDETNDISNIVKKMRPQLDKQGGRDDIKMAMAYINKRNLDHPKEYVPFTWSNIEKALSVLPGEQ